MHMRMGGFGSCLFEKVALFPLLLCLAVRDHACRADAKQTRGMHLGLRSISIGMHPMQVLTEAVTYTI